MRFEESQHAFSNPLTWVLVPVAAWMWFEMGVLLVTGAPSSPSGGNQPIDPRMLTILFLAVGVGLPAALVLICLQVRLDREVLVLRFRPFKTIRIPVNDIADVTPLTYRPIVDCLGWGIKRYRGGPAFTIAGSRAVHLHYRDADGRPKTILIGSRRPDALAAAITSATSTPSSDPGSGSLSD